MSNKTASSSGSIAIGGALLVLFVALKLIGIIDWSWWWVLAPGWIPPIIIVLITIGYLVVAVRRKK